MRRSARARGLAGHRIEVGARYRDRAGRLVVAEDHEIAGGRRTGRILVVEAEPTQQPPRRWLCRPADLTPAEPTGRAEP